MVETAATTGRRRGGARRGDRARASPATPRRASPWSASGRRRRSSDGAATLERAAAALGAGEPAELAAVDARRALDAMGRVTGETVDAEVLDAIFARFCIGK